MIKAVRSKTPERWYYLHRQDYPMRWRPESLTLPGTMARVINKRKDQVKH